MSQVLPLAPVAVFAFRRLDTLTTTLSALEKTEGFDRAQVFVFSDAARIDRAGEATEVERVRSYLRAWCFRVGGTLYESAENKGLRRSIVDGVSSMLSTHERLIVLEDDIVVSRSFLTFMNDALDAYESRSDIIQVSGNIVPHKRTLPTVGLLRTPACWGWATWRRAWQLYRDDAAELLSEMSHRDTVAFDINGSYGSLDALKRNAEGTLDTWFIRWYASVFLGGGLTVYPAQSLTRNIGFDDDSTNCKPDGTTEVFSRQKINNRPLKVDWARIGSSETPSFAAALEEFYRWQNYEWTKPTRLQRLQARLDALSRNLFRE